MPPWAPGTGERAEKRASHHAVSWVSTSPLWGTGWGRTTSKALTRSLATMNRVSGPAS